MDLDAALPAKGKNFSGNNLGQRKKSDFYETPYSMTRQFIEIGLFDRSQPVLEPACGSGAIVRVLRETGFQDVRAYDLEKDFLTETEPVAQIITNPPFSLALEFVLKAKEVAEERFAFLLPLSYLHGKERFDRIYTDTGFPLRSVHVFTRYPMLGDDLRENGTYRTGMMVYGWYLWDRKHTGSPTIDWLDNHSWVIGARTIQ